MVWGSEEEIVSLGRDYSGGSACDVLLSLADMTKLRLMHEE